MGRPGPDALELQGNRPRRPKSAPDPSDTHAKGPGVGPPDTTKAPAEDRWGLHIRIFPMTTEPSVDHRRIAIARARLRTWTSHRTMLGLEPGRLEALAAAIERASHALEDLEMGRTPRAAGRRHLGRAMEELRRAVEALGRGIAHRAIARETHACAPEAHAIAQEAHAIRTGQDPALEARPWRGAEMARPTIARAAVDDRGRVRLELRCPGLGRDPSVRVLVRRRVGRWGSYEPIGLARGGVYLDRHPQRAGRYAAYKVEVVGGPMAGATSRRALADFLAGGRPWAFAALHIGPAGPQVAPAPAPAETRAA